MAQDSSIRLRQLNQAELSGFVSGIFSLLSQPTVPTGNIIPSNSGVSTIGSPAYPYFGGYFNQVNLPSGSGINFGNTSFTAYTSGGFACVNVGGVTISSDLNGLTMYPLAPKRVASAAVSTDL